MFECFCYSHSTLNLDSLGSDEEKFKFLSRPYLSISLLLTELNLSQHCTRRTAGLQDSLEMFFIYLIDSSCQLSTSLSDIFFLKIPFFWMLRLLAAKFSKSVRVPAERVEWILADTDNVEPVKCLFGFIVFQRGPECRTNF